MNIWIFKADANHRLAIRTDIEYFQDHFVAKPLANHWNPPPIRVLNKSLPVRDFVSWMMSAPVISERARGALEHLFSGHCEILPLIELRRKLYYAVNVLTTVNCLDEEKSDICYAIDDPGYILSIRRYHLRNEMIPSGVSIFKIPQDVGTVFITKTFVESVRVNQLRGGMLLDPTVGIFEGLIRPELNLVPDLP